MQSVCGITKITNQMFLFSVPELKKLGLKKKSLERVHFVQLFEYWNFSEGI